MTDRSRAHWERCKEVARACDLLPGEVNRCWSKIKGLPTASPEDHERIKAVILKKRRFIRDHYRTTPTDTKTKPKNLTQAVRVMVWAIDTIDDLEMAKKAFDKAYEAVNIERI